MKPIKPIEDLIEFASIDTTDKGEEGARFISDYMADNKIETKVIRYKSKNPYVYGEMDMGAKSTLLIYNHYDVQPAEPLNKWKSDPFTPVQKEDRLFGRGVADDKGSLIARLQAVLESERLSVNVKFLYEGEEEIGSPNMEAFLQRYRNMIKADYVLWEGAGRGSSGAPLVVLGVKGLLYVELTARSEKDLHSMYAPVAGNPAWRLVRTLNSMKTLEGNITIPGFYNNVKKLKKEELKSLTGKKEKAEKALGQKIPSDFQKRLVEEPTCNIAGLNSGYTGRGAKTIIPSLAFAKMDFRLVPDQNPGEIMDSLKKFLAGTGVEVEMLASEKPYRTSSKSRIAQALISSAKKVYGMPPEVLPNSYGTGPMELFARMLGNVQIADGVGVDYSDSNIHSPNENIYIDDFYNAKEWMKQFLKTL